MISGDFLGFGFNALEKSLFLQTQDDFLCGLRLSIIKTK